MPRPLVYSNGSLFVGLDASGRIRDLFHPQIGLYNHLSGNAIRMGIWSNGHFSWTDADGWQRTPSYEPEALIGHWVLRHDLLGIELRAKEWVEPEADGFHRQIEVADCSGLDREVRLFFSHDLHIAETDIGDTAFFHPQLNGVVHYKGPHWFLFTLDADGRGMDEYACGTKGFGGFEGTWRDAEDGHLGMNPIAQGSVDSTIGIRFEIEAGGTARVDYRIRAAESLEALSEPVPAAPIAFRAERDRAAAAALEGRLEGLSPPIVELAKRSLLLIEAHIDRGGAVLAATDSDIMETARANYAYCWPRDAAHVCQVLDRAGRHEVSRRFFEFARRLISPERPYFLQKYRADGRFGASWHPWLADGEFEVPLQEDETASTLAALDVHIAGTGDEAWLQSAYEPFIKPMADFVADFRDPVTGLPKPSYDPWEERRGVHAYTVAAVWEGLVGAARLADRVGDSSAERYRQAADKVREAAVRHLRGPSGHFVRRLVVELGQLVGLDDLPDAATLWLGLSGLIDPKDPLFEIHMRGIWEALWVPGPVGGMARYRDDYYFRAAHEATGNPWIITTLWLAQCLIERAEAAEDLEEPLEMLVWAVHHAGPTGVLPEQLHPQSGAPLSVSPLTWSHAEFLKTALDWAEKKRALS